jgi:hypothetical protein
MRNGYSSPHTREYLNIVMRWILIQLNGPFFFLHILPFNTKSEFHTCVSQKTSPHTNLVILMNLDTNFSRRYLLNVGNLTSIGVASTYHTRIRDRKAIHPYLCSFNNTYHLHRLPSLTSKTGETAFQILNKTVWTNNKAWPDSNCECCGRVENMALEQTSIIFNIPHQSEILHIQDKPTSKSLLLLIQEVKRNIIYRRMNLPLCTSSKIPTTTSSTPRLHYGVLCVLHASQ